MLSPCLDLVLSGWLNSMGSPWRWASYWFLSFFFFFSFLILKSLILTCVEASLPNCVRGPTDWHHPSWPGKTVTTYMSYFTTGVPGKELGTNKLPPTRRIQERSKGEKRLQSICSNNLPDSSSLQSILAKRYVHHQEGPWVRMISYRQPRN